MLDTILKRRSCKAYKPDMVPDEIIEKIVKAGTYAASGMGKQAAIIVAITNNEVRDKLSKLNADILGAPIDRFIEQRKNLNHLMVKKYLNHLV